MKPGCCNFWCCCRDLHVNTNQAFLIRRECCSCLFCGIKWNVTDTSTATVADILYTGGCFNLNPKYQINFFGNLSPNDKVAFMSSIPFLP
jgi:hypothetical protein